MTTAFSKFNTLLDELVIGNLANLGSDTLKFALTNTAPTGATDTSYDPITKHPPPLEAHGYTAGGYAATIDSFARVANVYTLACTTDVLVTASGGEIGPFRYVLLYDDTLATDHLIGYWDRGASVTLSDGETFNIHETTGILWTITAT